MDNHGLFRARPRSQTVRPAWVIGAILLGILAALAPVFFASGATAKVSTATTYVPQTRTYYMAANEVKWNYSPTGKNQITGEPFDENASVFTKQGPDRIGSTYIKSLYQAYTDDTFKTLKQRTPAEEHLGFQGPVIRGVVGDTIKVVFKNNLDRPASVHVHGVFYDKSSEGAPYADGTSGAAKDDDGVAPGSTYTYTYEVPERAGPGPMDGSSVMWMYHSHTDEVADDYSGLVGPMVITKASAARADGTPNDVDREFFLQFKVSNENASPYLQRNIEKFAGKPSTVKTGDEDFGESNLMHSINGYVYGNQPLEALTMKKGERVRWYLMGMGTEVDLHTPHWHGNTVTALGMRTDVVNLLPASMVVADMVPDDVGTWLFHCHVNDHISAGMITRYRVLNADGTEGGTAQASPAHTTGH
jgi:FtsP/CotA-like multicopper oxidase with cupredoxin domain